MMMAQLILSSKRIGMISLLTTERLSTMHAPEMESVMEEVEEDEVVDVMVEDEAVKVEVDCLSLNSKSRIRTVRLQP